MAIESAESPELCPGVVASTWLTKFIADLNRADFCLKDSLTNDCYWRDLLVFTPNYRTIQSLPKVQSFFVQPVRTAQPQNFRVMPGVRVRKPVPSLTFIQGILQFDTVNAHCSGVFTLVQSEGSTWKAWALVTMADGMTGVVERFGPDYTPEHRTCDQSRKMKEEYVAIVIGGGQCGLSVAARLENLGLSTLIVERAARVGDKWRTRYDALQVNTPRSFSHLPFVPFPESWGQFFRSNDVAGHLEKYPDHLGLDVSTSTTMLSAVYRPKDRKWSIELGRKDGSIVTVTAHHIVAATGADTLAGATPIIPDIPDSASFRGVIAHSDQYTSSRSWNNQNVVVVGTGCSGHDIAQDLTNSGSRVVLVQRSPTAVISRETLYRFFPGLYFGENVPPTEIADRYWVALPLSASRTVQQDIMATIAHIDEKLNSALAAKGYLIPGPSDNFLHRLLVRRGLYPSYLMTPLRPSETLAQVAITSIAGAASLLRLARQITIKAGQGVERFTPSGVSFSDGSEADADLVVFATGYSNTTIRNIAEDIFGHEVAARVDDVGGWDEEWEYAGLWRPSGHPGLWFAGGDLFTARFYSRFLALQIFAHEKGLFADE
ncbi:hypothetical protein HYDPIDRAFT_30338 [Hydnomerulius pinastri MD-312]|uniref:FAD/NAD(P)-binding domain-containing protein n=1 Tax=Hydnomerulius pinastri MD-312 TaxID=994086 RepID=A0A0C9V9I9_9AGAM|nr:hypothetical protein HYDPIDRAFT_30338 [Hydnomerulius pinastri MD-312]